MRSYLLLLVVLSTHLSSTVATDTVECAASGTDEDFDCNAEQSLLQTEHQVHLAKEKVYYRQVLHNFLRMDVQYTATITVGDQNMQGVLDTGSFELLVFGKDCQTCGPNAHYDHSKSETYTPAPHKKKHRFGSGDAYSQDGYERAETGPLVAENMSFWEVYKAEMPVLKFSNIGAIVGVGPPGEPELEAEAEADLVHEAADSLEKKVGSKPSKVEGAEDHADANIDYAAQRDDSLLEAFDTTEFSVCLQEAPGSHGYFGWNDENFSQKPDLFTSVPVAGKVTWGVEMTDVELQNDTAKDGIDVGCEDGCGAILDSGTSLLVMPKKTAERIKDTIGNFNDYDLNCSSMDMSGMPNLNFKLAGETYSLPPEAYLTYVLDVDGGSTGKLLKGTNPFVCKMELAVMAEDADTQFGPLWILGMPFFRKYHTTFQLGGRGGQHHIHTAISDGKCELLEEVAPTSPRRHISRTLDLSKASISPGLAHAFASGHMSM